MTEEDIRDVVVFIRSHQPKFSTEGEHKVTPDSNFYVSLYDRRAKLLPGSRNYDKAMDEVYIREAIKYFE